MAKAFIGVGSNLGDRAALLELARVRLAQLPQTRLVGFSPTYETAPVGPVPQGRFLNAAAELTTELAPEVLLDHLRGIEAEAGRPPENQRVRWGPRALDLDILLYDDQVLTTPRLRVPHPHLHERWFVLRPLSDLAPEVRHPTLGRTIAQLLREVEGPGPDAPR